MVIRKPIAQLMALRLSFGFALYAF